MSDASRKFVFTGYRLDREPTFDPETMRYLVYSQEFGDDQNNPHWQGAVAFHKQIRACTSVLKHLGQVYDSEWTRKAENELRKALGGFERDDDDGKKFCGWAQRMYTPWNSFKYIGKEGYKVHEHGTKPAQGARTDLHDLKQAIEDGKTTEQIAENNFDQYIRYHNAIDKLVAKRQTKKLLNSRRERPYVVVFWGDTHSGKTKMAENMAKAYATMNGFQYFMKSNARYDRWPNAYDGHEVIHFKEFDWKKMDRATFLDMVDEGYVAVDCFHKGETPFNAKFIAIDCKEHPQAWWNGEGHGAVEVLSRITKIEWCEKIPTNMGRKRKAPDAGFEEAERHAKRARTVFYLESLMPEEMNVGEICKLIAEYIM